MGEPTDIVTRYFEALSTGDVDGAVALIADNADFRTPMGPIPDPRTLASSGQFTSLRCAHGVVRRQ